MLASTTVIRVKMRSAYNVERQSTKRLKRGIHLGNSGEIRGWRLVTEVWLNPPKEIRAEEQKLLKTT